MAKWKKAVAKRVKGKKAKRPKKLKKTKAKRLKKPVVFIVIDGLADLPMSMGSLKGKTPLSEAKKPNMDWLAEQGAVGEITPVPRSLWSELAHASVSHIANISLLGFDPKRYRLKRGTLEAVGVGLPYKEGHLAVRCNFATVDKELNVIDRHAGREYYGLNDIARYINTHVKIGVPFVFIRTFEHRAVLIIKESLSDEIIGNDPLKDGKKVKGVEALKPRAQRSADLLQSFADKAYNVIEYHPRNAERMDRGALPANYILFREAGNELMALPNFPRRWHIDKAACIAENGVMKATCMLAGFNSITVPELGFERTLDFIFDNIDTALAEYSFVYAHIKGPIDEAAHDGSFRVKLKGIEAVDKRLAAFRDFNGVLVLTTDHITSCERREHVAGAVPVLVYGRRRDTIKSFDEFAAKKGSLKKLTGRQLLKYIFGR